VDDEVRIVQEKISNLLKKTYKEMNSMKIKNGIIKTAKCTRCFKEVPTYELMHPSWWTSRAKVCSECYEKLTKTRL